jgi:hypothetical protein
MVRHIQGKRGKKMGGGRETSGNGSYFPAAHLLSLGLIRRCAPFRRERSERAESPTENHEKTPTAVTKKSLQNLNYVFAIPQEILRDMGEVGANNHSHLFDDFQGFLGGVE